MPGQPTQNKIRVWSFKTNNATSCEMLYFQVYCVNCTQKQPQNVTSTAAPTFYNIVVNCGSFISYKN